MDASNGLLGRRGDRRGERRGSHGGVRHGGRLEPAAVLCVARDLGALWVPSDRNAQHRPPRKGIDKNRSRSNLGKTERTRLLWRRSDSVPATRSLSFTAFNWQSAGRHPAFAHTAPHAVLTCMCVRPIVDAQRAWRGTSCSTARQQARYCTCACAWWIARADIVRVCQATLASR